MQIPVVLDSGFNGELMLVEDTIDSLKLDHQGREEYTVASGAVVKTDLYSAYVHWFGDRRLVTVLATKGHENLLGMELLSDCEFTFNVPEKTLQVRKVSQFGNHNQMT